MASITAIGSDAPRPPATAAGPARHAPLLSRRPATIRVPTLAWLLGLALLVAVVVGTINVSEAEAFVRLTQRARPWWLAVALVLQLLTYSAQGAVWRIVATSADARLSHPEAYRLSLVKLFADQALPSGGISGTVVVASALERQGFPPAIARAAVLLNLVGYHAAYVGALAIALGVLAASGVHAVAATIATVLFTAFAAVLGVAVVQLSGGRTRPALTWARRIAPLRRVLAFIEGADAGLVRNPRLLRLTTTWQLVIVALDVATMWTLLRAVGAAGPIAGVFASFMIASLVRTLGIVPGGLGTFEATSVITLSLAGISSAAALAATLLFRGLSFWLPMGPGFLASRVALRRPAADTRGDGWWTQTPDALFRELGSGPAGLTEVEARRRLADTGPNALRAEGRLTGAAILLRQFANPLLLLLLFAVAVAMANGEWLDSAIVLTIVVASVAITMSREISAETAVAALRERLHAVTQVIRDGHTRDIPLEDVVPGDLIVLSAGHLVAADAVVVAASHCYASEAPLTGESFPVAKRPGTCAADAPLHRRANCVHLGTAIQSGSATAIAVRTGARTEMGRIAGRLAAVRPETEFERGLRRFGYMLITTMLVMVIIVFVTHVLRGRPASDTLLFSVALAVGLSPELLPAILTANLARDARSMAARGVLVRRLNAIENLGSMDVLCTDKTGTLTEGVVRLDAAVGPQGEPDDRVLAMAGWNARLTAGIAGPLDAAIVAGTSGGPLPDKLADIPFDASRRRVSIVVRTDDAALLVTKGAFEAVLEACSTSRGAPLSDADRDALRRRYVEWASCGIRVVGVASGTVERRTTYSAADEHHLDFSGFVTFIDRVKDDAREALEALHRLGISVVVITGDNALVATHVARSVGLTGGVVRGPDLEALPEAGLARLAERTQVFAELDPAQKERVVVALRRSGHVVGFLGDGVNDVAAMHAADTSLAVDAAIDVARQAADFVLLERGLDVIRRGVEDGRRTFANTLKYVLITMSANLGNMMSMAAASLVLPFLPMSAGQVLLNNFLSDIPAVGLAGDRVDPELVEQPRRWDVAAIRRYMVRFGLLSSVFDAVTFALLLFVFHAVPDTFRTGWFVESLLTELAVALVVRTRRPWHQSRPGTVLLWTTVGVAVVALAIPYLPGNEFLGFVPLPPLLLLAVIAVTASYVVAAEAAKRRLTTI